MSQDSSRAGFVLGVQAAAALLMAQQIAGKAARDGLFLLHHGPEALPGMVAGSAAFSVVLSFLSGRLLRHVAPRVVAPWGIGISGVLLLVEGWLLGVRPGAASVLIYLHIAGVGAVLLSTFWSMLNEEFDPREAKKNFGRIAAGGTVGGLIGGLAAERTVAWSGAFGLMLLMAILHLAAGVFIAVLMAKGAPAARGPAAAVEPPKTRGEAPHRSALLQTLAGIVLLGAFGAALLDYVFKVYVTTSFGRGADLLRFFAFFHAGVAVSSFVLQSAAAKLVLEKFGLGTTALTLPATLGGGSFLTLVAPGAGVAILARAAEAAVRGSLFRAGYETAYTPVPAADKRLAKAFIDVAAERVGDALGAAAVYLCLLFAGISAPPWILSFAALAGFASALLCLRLDQVYVGTLARSLEAGAVQLSPDSDLDLTTRTVMMRSPTIRAGLTESWRKPTLPTTGEDAVLERLAALRSSDPRRVQSALRTADLSDPLLAAQVCLLLRDSQFAPLAQTALMGAPEKVLGLLTDFLLNHSLDVGVRRMLPRIIASAGGPRAADCLVAGLQDNRFEVRLQCARSLAKTWAKLPSYIVPEKILAAVDHELTIGANLWESHRRQQTESGEEWLDELLRDKAHGSLEYVFTLLSLLHERAPLMAAFRSLHLDDRRLRGTAIEYLEGILPPKTREKLWDILQEQPSKAPAKKKSEIMQELMNASETVVLRLREQRGPGTGRVG